MGLPQRCVVCILTMSLSLGLLPTLAGAHSIYIFAYQENSQICTNSYFGGKAKVRGGQVSMATVAGEVLATAQTDEQGKACFDRPEKVQELTFTVKASGGHRAEFKLPASELSASGFYDSESHLNANQGKVSAATGAEAPVICAGSMTSDDLHQALSPILLMLAEMKSAQSSQIGLKDIIGGLGWLIGLAGAALWASSRKSTARTKDF